MKHARLLESIAVSPIATVITNPRRADNPLERNSDQTMSLSSQRAARVRSHR